MTPIEILIISFLFLPISGLIGVLLAKMTK